MEKDEPVDFSRRIYKKSDSVCPVWGFEKIKRST